MHHGNNLDNYVIMLKGALNIPEKKQVAPLLGVGASKMFTVLFKAKTITQSERNSIIAALKRSIPNYIEKQKKKGIELPEADNIIISDEEVFGSPNESFQAVQAHNTFLEIKAIRELMEEREKKYDVILKQLEQSQTLNKLLIEQLQQQNS